MPSADAQNLADLVGSPFASRLVGAMPEPAIIVGPDERAVAANQPALQLLPGLRVGDPFVLGLRAPDVIDARRRVMVSGEAETVQWSERVPVERLFDVCVAPLAFRCSGKERPTAVRKRIAPTTCRPLANWRMHSSTPSRRCSRTRPPCSTERA